jgi:hypothetical protein
VAGRNIQKTVKLAWLIFLVFSSIKLFLGKDKEVTADYVPQTRGERFAKVPSALAGDDLVFLSESEMDNYSSIEKTMKNEYISKRIDW